MPNATQRPSTRGRAASASPDQLLSAARPRPRTLGAATNAADAVDVPADYQVNLPRGQLLAILSLVATAGVPVLFLLVRLRMFTFRDDFTGLNAVGFFISWALVLLLAGALLGGLAWRASRRSWLVRCAVVINGVLLIGTLWLLVSLSGW